MQNNTLNESLSLGICSSLAPGGNNERRCHTNEWYGYRERNERLGASGAGEKIAGPDLGQRFGGSRENEAEALACKKLIRCTSVAIIELAGGWVGGPLGVLGHYARAAFGPLRGMGVLGS